jgi:ATP/maltotriose-dependent transcriptional regulator MalT
VPSATEVEALIDRGLRRGREVGEASPVYALALLNHGCLRWNQGRLEEGLHEIRHAMAIQDAIHPRPIEACIARQVLGQREMSRGNLREAVPLLQESLPCMERAFLPGAMVLMWARLSQLELLVLQGHFGEAAGPLDALQAEAAQRLPKARWLIAEVLLWRGRSLCKSGAADEGKRVLTQSAGLFAEEMGEQSPAVQAAGRLLPACGK